MMLTALLLVVLAGNPAAPRETRSVCMLGPMSGYILRSSGSDSGMGRGRGYEAAEVHLGGDTLMSLDHTLWSSVMTIQPDGGMETVNWPPNFPIRARLRSVKVRCEAPGVTVTLGHATMRLIYSANPRRLEFDPALVEELQRARSGPPLTERERTRLVDLQTLVREITVTGSEQISEQLDGEIGARLATPATDGGGR